VLLRGRLVVRRGMVVDFVSAMPRRLNKRQGIS
jgi:hypothetical protein